MALQHTTPGRPVCLITGNISSSNETILISAVMHYHVAVCKYAVFHKKGDTTLMVISLLNLNPFSNLFHWLVL